ncbi:Type-1A pilin [Serratia quinivorans]|jgi:type 1 fimbria pilin|uniref:fimbrial protein n=1 Tax=Serratia TaxID=613 RepID=UPI00036963BD|nr:MULTISPECIES: fimbrial protein [Serratia]MBV6694197.1 fimbrial protein [Serratia quinivorans]CAI1769228.1 Type-1A pilin [Serratia quinivorans]CAI1794226.1 Type-1A pilin [Serratia quinivorans]CAI1896110.1 Type-1A pilin [Serratia quinivorans]
MKKTLLATSLFASSLFAATAMAATVPGGTLNFVGTVVDAACAVSAGQGGTNSTVQMGQVTLRSMGTSTTTGTTTPVTTTTYVAGTRANVTQPFKIVLTACDTTTQKNAAITFKGTASVGNTKVLSVGTGAGSAQGIGLQIYGANGTAIDLGDASPVIALNAGENSLDFSADYITTSTTPKAGQANATATFTVTYS